MAETQKSIVDSSSALKNLPIDTNEQKWILLTIAKEDWITLPELKILQEKFKDDVDALNNWLLENCNIITAEAKADLAQLGQECIKKIESVKTTTDHKENLSLLLDISRINPESVEGVKMLIITALETWFIHNQNNDDFLVVIDTELKKNGIENGLGITIPKYNNSERKLVNWQIVDINPVTINWAETNWAQNSNKTDTWKTASWEIDIGNDVPLETPIKNILPEITLSKPFTIQYDEKTNIVSLSWNGHTAYFTYWASENDWLINIWSIQNWANWKIKKWNSKENSWKKLREEAKKATDALLQDPEYNWSNLKWKLEKIQSSVINTESKLNTQTSTPTSSEKQNTTTVTQDDFPQEKEMKEANIWDQLVPLEAISESWTFSKINGNTLNKTIDEWIATIGNLTLKYLKNSDRIRCTLWEVSFTLRVSELSQKEGRKTYYLGESELQTKFEEKYNKALSEQNTEKAEAELSKIKDEVEKISMKPSDFFKEPLKPHEQAWIDTLSWDEVTLNDISVTKDAQNNTIITFDIDDSGLNDEVNSDFVVNLKWENFNEASFKENVKTLVHERVNTEPNKQEILVEYEKIKDALNRAIQKPNKKQEIWEMYNEKITVEFDSLLDGFYLKIWNNNSIHLSEINYNEKEITFPTDYLKNVIDTEIDKVMKK